MPRCGRSLAPSGPRALQTLFLLILSTTISCAPTSQGTDILILDDAGGASDFYTSPIVGSNIPQDPNDPSISRWTTQDCSTCPSPRPALENVKNSTYTAVYIPAGDSYTYDISFQFNGSQIDVYLILSNQAPTSCDFVLDGNSTHFGASTTDIYQYQKLAFSSTMLDARMHELKIKAVGSPDTANYLNFDYAQLNRSTTLATRTIGDSNLPSGSATLSSSSLSSPSPSPTGSSHETAKAIAGGVVGGFIAIVALIVAASFYRHRRLKELEDTAHPFITNSGSNTGATTPSSGEERRHLMSHSISQSNNHQSHPTSRHFSTHTSAMTGVTPFTLQSPTSNEPPNLHPPTTIRFGLPDPYPNPDSRDQVRQERQRELNHSLDAVTTQMRSLKSSYLQDHQRLQNLQGHMQRNGHNGYTGENNDTYPPVMHVVPGGMPDPLLGQNLGRDPMPHAQLQHTGEQTVTPSMLTDMREQMQVMMDQIQYLRAQQNSPYTQALTDERPPGYVDVINSYHGRGDR